MSIEKIGKFEAICLILIIIINEIILDIPKLIVNTTGSSAILNIVFISLIGIGFSYLFYKLLINFSSMDIIDISEFLGGKFFKIITCFLFLLFLLFLSFIQTRYLANSIKIIYFNSSPLIFIISFFIFPSIIINKLCSKSIFAVNVVFTIIFIISLLVLFLCLFNRFSIYRIFPVLGNGSNETFIKGSTNIFAYTGLAYLLLLPPFLKDEKDFKKVSIISIFFTAILLIISIVLLVLTLPIIKGQEEMLSFYLLIRKIDFGIFLERLDALFFLIWLLSFFSYLSINMFFIINIFKKTFNIRNDKFMPYLIGLLILMFSLFIKNFAQIMFLENTCYRYLFIFLVFLFSFPVLILTNIKFKKNIGEKYD